MRYALPVIDGVELHSGSSPLPEGAIAPVPNWDDVIDLPFYYRKIVDGQVVEKTQAEKDAYDDAHPPTTEELQEQALQYLYDTDWYVIRSMDPGAGDEIPPEIVEGRATAREVL
ncbi:MAG: hypothetical protein DRP56_03765, partial [Planctomycetota bacterium]